MLRPQSTVRCVIPFVYVLVPVSQWLSRSHPIYNSWVAGLTRQFDNEVPNPILFLPSRQIFAYLAFATSSLLMVLRMYIFFWGSLCEAYGGHQNRHLEQENNYCCSRDWCMGGQHCVPNSG